MFGGKGRKRLQNRLSVREKKCRICCMLLWCGVMGLRLVMRKRCAFMIDIVRNIYLGGLIILCCSAILLASDWSSRSEGLAGGQRPKVAIVKFNSNLLLDEAEEALVARLAERGYRDGDNIVIQRFCPEADGAAHNIMARQVTDGSFDIVATISTLSLQAVANANKDGRAKHVFCTVTDPVGAGVGIKSLGSLDKPQYLTGIGTFQPVEEILVAAKKLNPQLKNVGAIWNAAETNSEACIIKARAISKQLNIELLEASIQTSADIVDAAQSLVTRGAEAFWVGCDNIVNTSIGLLTSIAQTAKIPVLSNIAGHVRQGSFFDLGANYAEVGSEAANITADILDGKSPAKIPVTNYMPQKIAINKDVGIGLKDRWRIPAEYENQAVLIIEKGKALAVDKVASKKAPDASPSVRLPKRVRLIELVATPAIEESTNGVLAGLEKEGLRPDIDYVVERQNAQGDMPTMVSMIDSAASSRVDLIITVATPTLQAAMQKVQDVPIVYTLALDPLLVGDTGTHEKHRANVAGVYDRSPFEGMLEIIKSVAPQVKKIGTLYAPGEPNAVNFRDELIKAAQAQGVEVVALPSNSSAEVNDSALALIQRGVELICQINDNLHGATFPAIIGAATRARIPVFAFSSKQVEQGAVLALANDNYDGGLESGQIAAQVLRGVSPATIPYRGINKTILTISVPRAREYGLELPEKVVRRADKVYR